MQKVLIVENNPTITKLLTHFFEEAGWQTTCAENGLEALVALDSHVPDIMITDIIMPKISGDRLCQLVRGDKRVSDVFLVVHSSIVLEDKENIFDLDADMYIAKGASEKYKDLISKIINHYENDIRRSKDIFGAEGLVRRGVTTELLLARHHYQTIFANITDAVLELDQHGTIIQVNKAAVRLFSLNAMELLSTQFVDYVSGNGRENVVMWLERSAKQADKNFESNYEEPLKIGNVLIALNMVSLVDNGELFVVAIVQNITKQKVVEAKLEDTLMDLDAVIESIDYGVCFLDKDLRVRLVNRAFRKMWNIPKQLAADKLEVRSLMYYNRYNNIYDVSDEMFDEYVESRIAAILKGPVAPMEFVRKDGVILQYQSLVLPGDGRMLSYYDITDLKMAQADLADTVARVSELANHDPLTKLANIRLAKERLKLSLSNGKRKKLQVAVMFIDLDGFKEVNDNLGHEAGDFVLQLVAERLKGLLRSSDTVARIGGDEFLIIQTEVTDRASVELVAQKIISSIKEPFEVGGELVHIGASLGIALYPEDGLDGRELIKKADSTMYKVKAQGKNNYLFAS